jgi:CDP-glucose 4,6-dehydratase
VEQRKGGLETLEMNTAFWHSKRVFLTGHTGFKGSWLSLWLQHMGADVIGYSLESPSSPSLFDVAKVGCGMTSMRGDVRDLAALHSALNRSQPEIVIHMAAQSLVRLSYQEPVETYATNVMGSVHLLDAVRHCSSVRSVLMVTSDKCYENHEWPWGYRENEAMGGYDPYSNSKGCSELVTAAYRKSFFGERGHSARVASGRAGNVIGGGDWARDRLIPDMIRATEQGQSVRVRNPEAIRPWQHVLEPLSGYLALAERLYRGDAGMSDGWNFGPDDNDARPVRWIAEHFTRLWGNGASWTQDHGNHPHEAHYLKLDCSKARSILGWAPRWSLDQALSHIVSWHRAHQQGAEMRNFTLSQIDSYIATDSR